MRKSNFSNIEKYCKSNLQKDNVDTIDVGRYSNIFLGDLKV